MKIEKVSIDKLKQAEYNPRKNLKKGDPEYEKLKRSIKEFDYIEPVIWNSTTGNIVGGHQRYKILKDMGMKEIDCVIVAMDETKEKMANIALNKIAGDWEFTALADLLAELDTGAIDMSLLGFDDKELEQIATYSSSNMFVSDDDAFGGLNKEKGEYEQITFTLTNNQAGIVRDAIKKATKQGEGENENGNAIAHICEKFLNEAV